MTMYNETRKILDELSRDDLELLVVNRMVEVSCLTMGLDPRHGVHALGVPKDDINRMLSILLEVGERLKAAAASLPSGDNDAGADPKDSLAAP